MIICSKLSSGGQVKSIMRLPYISHPTTLRIKKQLNAIKTDITASNPSAETICSVLSKLAELHKCMGDVLNQSPTQVLMSQYQNKKLQEELLDESLKILDICGSTRDVVTQYKEHIRDLHSAVRKQKYENGIKKYKCFRKKMKKDVKLLIADLKQVDTMITSGGSVVVDSDNQELVAVVQAVTGVNEMTVSVFKSLLLYFCTPISKPNRWSLMLPKLIHKGTVASEDQQKHGNMNEFESIVDGLQILCKDGSSIYDEKIQSAKLRLERQEGHLDCMETRLECLFRRLIGTRACLLNITSFCKA